MSDKYNMAKHIRSVHCKLKEKTCPHCDFTTSAKQTLLAHIKAAHEKVKDHKCPKCDYVSSWKGYLKNT